MPDGRQNDLITTELDPEQLSTPFGVQTNWHVITGAPCSGKTTLIDQLAAREFQTVPESAREYFETEMARGRTIDGIRESQVDERRMMELQLGIEHGLRATDVAFLDRALPDCLAFYRASGLNPSEILAECFHHRYASVFILDRLPVQENGIRTEDDPAADLLDVWLTRDYRALGYPVARVPVLPPEERLAFVLQELSDRGLI